MQTSGDQRRENANAYPRNFEIGRCRHHRSGHGATGLSPRSELVWKFPPGQAVARYNKWYKTGEWGCSTIVQARIAGLFS